MWYYQDPKTEERAGPVKVDFIRDLIEANLVRDDTLVWTKGMVDWEAISQVPIFMTPLEKDLKEYYTPGKNRNTREREVAQMKEFEEGWYFEDELKETHGPIFKEDLVEVVKAAAEWDTPVWNINVLVEDEGERLTFRQAFPEHVGDKASVYKDLDAYKKDVQRMEEKVHESPVPRPSMQGNASEEQARGGLALSVASPISSSSSSSLDMALASQQPTQRRRKGEREDDGELKTPESNHRSAGGDAGSKQQEADPKPKKEARTLTTLLQDAEASLKGKTPQRTAEAPKPSSKDGASSGEVKAQEEEKEPLEVKIQPGYSKEDLEKCEMGKDFLSRYIAVQRQSLLYRKDLFRTSS
ncbi:hypothetical protein HOP50_16g77350 [Chloropicon primus]|uniref:GYF domain-containing protein n=1 Tax=Chloropicon primus TaxID=1764295 RepID=A0A5B8MX78_9CHLO|nr:hypothetical protein A3770_16p77070 [Chloropicon primus]UPR04394.1 hypothetical protein HOP50_16g77350 [Chloropicon primus]|eukprot:QDZ25189.1 hypothetical protein A3770_16p77070 [Chloropicon primus]